MSSHGLSGALNVMHGIEPTMITQQYGEHYRESPESLISQEDPHIYTSDNTMGQPIAGISQPNLNTYMYAVVILVVLVKNSYPTSATYMRQWIRSALVQIMACCLFGAKPLSKLILGYCQLDPWDQISLKF